MNGIRNVTVRGVAVGERSGTLELVFDPSMPGGATAQEKVARHVAAPADYDGDGKTDPAVFTPSSGEWSVLKSSTDYTPVFNVSWGVSTDTPFNKRP